MEEDKCYLVITKERIGHKIYAKNKEEAMEAYKDGEEVDDFSLKCEVEGIEEY